MVRQFKLVQEPQIQLQKEKDDEGVKVKII